jgi:hypothetical protein
MNMPTVSASSRCTIRWARPGSVLARWSSRRIWRPQGCEHRLDHEADAGLADLYGWALAEPALVGHDELDADQPEAFLTRAAAVTGVLVGRPQVVMSAVLPMSLRIAQPQRAALSGAPDPG